jgi:hypothetical protein
MESRFLVVVLARIYSDTSPPKKASFLPPLCSVFKERNYGAWPHLSNVRVGSHLPLFANPHPRDLSHIISPMDVDASQGISDDRKDPGSFELLVRPDISP